MSKNKKNLLAVLLLISMVFAMVSNARAETAPELDYSGEITFYAQAYQPVEPSDTNPNPPTAFLEVAEAYEKLHPDIHINFITSVSSDDYVTWLKTKLSSGMAPDIVWAQGKHLIGETYPKGTMINLKPYFDEMPNPYVEGNEKWGDLFRDSLQAQITDTNGEIWGVNGDFVATVVIYNMEMFEQAGIEELPETWSEYIQVCEKLKQAGYTPWMFPFGNDADSTDKVTWLARLFYTNYYGNDFPSMAVLGSNELLSTAEVALAFKNGIYDVRDPKYLHFWQLIKDQMEYMPDDCLSPTNDTTAILNQFINGEIAMYWDGSWARRDLESADPDFEYGMFSFPVPTPDDDEYATGINSTNSVGGPSAAFQFSVPSERANQSLTDEKLAAIIDWLMFITTPENNSVVVNDLGSFVPTIRGAEAAPGSEQILESLDEPFLMLEGGVQSFGSTYLETYYRTFQEFLNDSITLEEAADRLEPLAMQSAEDIIFESDTDLSEFIK